jgi:outer membrane receptor protein involved in Fe transport
MVSAMLASVAATAIDSPPANDAARLDRPPEIIVTGERLPRRLRDTPSSVVVVTSEMIEANGDDRVDQLLAAIPNVQPGSGEEGPAIRGQDSTGLLRNLFAFLGGTRPRVTLQVDGRAVSYYEYVSGSSPTWDVERVEIFRSPQTTTQGRNSIAGAIFVETRDPSFDWQGRGRLIAGGLHTRQASAMVSGPLVRDQLAVRISGDLRRSQMASDMADDIAGADIRRDDYGIARLKLLFTPTALPGLRVETAYVHTQSQAPQFEAVAAPFEQRRFPLPERTNGVMRTNVDSLTARIEAPLGATLHSTVTLSAGDADLQRFGLPGLGLTKVDNRDGSAEGVVRWAPSKPFQLLLGVHGVATRQRQSIDITGLGIGVGSFRDRQESVGLFGEANWKPVARLTVTAGLRYQRDHQDRFGAVGSGPRGIYLDYDERFSAWLPKLSVAYALSDAVNVGVLVQRAYNPGGTSISLSRRVEDRFEAERLRNVEGFVRATFGNGRGTLAANLFHNRIRDAQRQLSVAVPVPGGGVIFASEFANAPKATSYGLETQIGWQWSPRLRLDGGIGLLRTRLDRTILPTDPSLGKDFQRSPRLSAVAAIDWRPADKWRLSAQVRHHGGYFSDDANTPARRIDASTMVNVRAAWEAGRTTLFGYARNSFNRFALTYLFTPTFGTAEDPREIGVGIDRRF